MKSILQVVALSCLIALGAVAITGCGTKDKTGGDKMSGDKMSDEKMSTDKKE
jgi:hypothetical protein